MRKFQVLLVDDDELALQGLEQGINWDGLNIEKVFKCHSKDTAIRMIQTYPIHMIITDIEMPNGSGLELIKWVKTNRPDILAAFYTGHADFSYAREALRLGAEDYLLKPVPYPEMESILLRMEEKIINIDKKVDFVRLEEEENQGNTGEIVEQVKQIVAENLSVGNLQRDEIAALVHLSPGYLGRIFKKETGLSISDYIVKVRIAVSRQLLVKTSLSITDISARVGISYPSYFTKIFKEQTGMTPQEYRQKYKL